MDRQTVFDYIKKKYHVLPEYPWRKYDSNAVFRHTDNKKWFALVMDVQGNKLGLSGSEYIDVVNLKMDDLFFRDIIIKEDGIMPAYHMNKMHWVTVLLNGITALMKIRLLKRYAPEQFTFEVLKSEYGIYAIRGPRGVPNSLSSALKG